MHSAMEVQMQKVDPEKGYVQKGVRRSRPQIFFGSLQSRSSVASGAQGRVGFSGRSRSRSPCRLLTAAAMAWLSKPKTYVRSGDRLEIPHCPDGQLGPVFDGEFPKDSIEIFLDRTFGQVEFERDLLVQHGLANQPRDLLFTEREIAVERPLAHALRRLSAAGAYSSRAGRKLASAAVAGLNQAGARGHTYHHASIPPSMPKLEFGRNSIFGTE